MRYLMNGMQVDQKIASMNNASLEHCLSLLKKSSVGSLAVNDNDRFNTYKLQKFLHMSHQVEHYSAQRNEAFPGELLTPKQDVVVPTNIIDRLVEFYQRSYADMPFLFRKPTRWRCNCGATSHQIWPTSDIWRNFWVSFLWQIKQ